ncbi:small GTPase superfamily [Lasiosphaeris hirsuta]|uniref:Small GTPase superfamily n=1 Tax=Lasiosphaeris hirsuta TaxID=260670 RepID=A0AA40E576_9PEZI|nr:small GTPase superfamily [Lasiosphaeris hirsuta]
MHPLEYRIAVIGGMGSDKGRFTLQFLVPHSAEMYDSTDWRLDDYDNRKRCTVDGEHCELDILETTGQEEYSAMREQYMRAGEGFLLVYSATNRGSFEDVMTFHQEILRAKDTDDYFPMVVVDNNCEQTEAIQVSTEEGKALAESFKCRFVEADATTGSNVQTAFCDLVREIRRHFHDGY